MTQVFANNAVSVLSASVTTSSTSMTVANGAVFPALSGDDYFTVTLYAFDTNGNETGWEIVKVTARTGNVLTVTRAQEGTTATAWAAGTRTELRLTAATLNDVVAGASGSGVALSGSTSAVAMASATYTITNYSAFSTYSVQVSAGSVEIVGDQITFTAPVAVQPVTMNVTVDGVVYPFSITVTPSCYIPPPTPTPAAFGDPLEGGFYAGLYWDQIAQSATSKLLATGSQAFTVPDMLGNGIVYVGQSVEVRSRNNPANKFIGTVASAVGTTLTITVSSIGGSGTFSDWSVMSKFRSIVAPKSSGENTIALKNAQTAFPTGCQSLVDGLTATNAMKNADTSTVYPAAHWARGLSIGGYTDWHIPARDVLELAYRNLKPIITTNYQTADREVGASFNYTINGTYGALTTGHGVNNNSSPVGAAYAGTPTQTASVAFRTGGAEAFSFGSAIYLSSTEQSTQGVWSQAWYTGYAGKQEASYHKADALLVRAVRRSII